MHISMTKITCRNFWAGDGNGLNDLRFSGSYISWVYAKMSDEHGWDVAGYVVAAGNVYEVWRS